MSEAHLSEHGGGLPRGQRDECARIGAVMTPLAWARWVVDQSQIVPAILAGGAILEPCCGTGVFLEAIFEAAEAAGLSARDVAKQVWAVDRDAGNVDRARARLAARWGVQLRGNLQVADILEWTPPRGFAAAVGNPPWVTFAALPDEYKDFARERFEALGLVGARRELLLGLSRADLASAIVQRVLSDVLRADGQATFLLPLSLLFADGANNRFRRFSTARGPVALEVVHDLTNLDVFGRAAATRYGAVTFRCGVGTSWPVPFRVHRRGASDLRSLGQPREVGEPLMETDDGLVREEPVVVVPAGCVPRQGLNSCGANDIYFVRRDEHDGDRPRVTDGSGRTSRVPARFLFPVATSAVFRGSDRPERWVVLPYEPQTGRPLASLKGTGLEEYFLPHRQRLMDRKGTMVRGMISRGLWWAMLGVGPYCFAPWKVAWEALGRRKLSPRVLGVHEGQPWQANQAMQAFLPFADRGAAEGVARRLAQPDVEAWLLAQGAGGTKNWAQPGRIGRLLLSDVSGRPSRTFSNALSNSALQRTGSARR